MSRKASASQAVTPLDGIDLLLADLDGVVYQGPHAIAHAVESLNQAQQSIRVGYITNNASRTDKTVAEHLESLGLTVAPEEVVTSPQAAMTLLTTMIDPGSRVLVVGGDGLVDELHKAGFEVTRSADEHPAAVVQGFAPDVGWAQLAEASFALRAPRDGSSDGIPWVATNTDWTIPVDRGIAPGNGTLVAAVHTATGRMPVVAGKPERAIFDAAVERFGATRPLFIGDRLDTDILGANRAGIPSVLVLTGIDGPKQVLAADEHSRPTFILADLRGLHEPYPAVVESRGRGRARVFRSGDAEVELDGRVLTLEASGDAHVDVVRAGAAAIWASGQAIYALEVPAELYSTA